MTIAETCSANRTTVANLSVFLLPSFCLAVYLVTTNPSSHVQKHPNNKQGRARSSSFLAVRALPRPTSCFVTTTTGDLRDDACGDGRAGGEGSFKVDAAVGYTFGIDDGSGLGGAGAQVGVNSQPVYSPRSFQEHSVRAYFKRFQFTLRSSYFNRPRYFDVCFVTLKVGCPQNCVHSGLKGVPI